MRLNFLIVLYLVVKENLAILAEDTATIIDADIPGRQNDKFSNSIYPYVRNPPERDDTDTPYPDDRYSGGGDPGRRCSTRLESALDQIRRRQGARERLEDRRRSGVDAGGGASGAGDLHLDGYSLHQPLRSAPLDMYVTDMRVRLPTSSSWVRVDSCRFDPRNASLQTRISFNDLTISGRVNLLGDRDALLRRHPINDEDLDDLPSRPACNMILRLRRAGIGFHTEPIRRERGQFNVRTDSHFLEPGFISVFAYGCEPKTRSTGGEDELAREMEDVFLRGIRSLLTAYMQKELQPAIKETLMTNMGYTVSYG